MLAVSGVHNSGKTTLLEKLLPVLRSRGLKVGVIKHDGHDFTPDVPGTDSFRLREAGAEGVAVYSGTRYLLTEEFRLTEQDLLALADAADCLFYDVKHADDDAHRELTGQGNGLILDNLDAVLDRAAGKLTVRLPLIPGLNDDEGHLENFARTIKALGRVHAVELLPYHRYGEGKYRQLGRAYPCGAAPYPEERLEELKAFLAARSTEGLLSLIHI